MESETRKCSKCGKNPPSNGNPWCQDCRTEHARKTKETEALLVAVRGWNRGAQAIRYAMARQFAMAPGATFEGNQIAKWMMEFPIPQYAEQEVKASQPSEAPASSFVPR
jgi:hypothetical protein